MGHYDKFVFQYINGTLEPRDVHFLEQQDEFMKKVITLTRDKKYFDKLPDRVKRDGDFILELIDMFKDDHEFLAMMGEEVLSLKNYESREVMEITVTLSNLYEETQDEVLYDFYDRGECYFRSIEEDIRKEIMAETDYYERKNLGEGFILTDMSFHDSPITKEFVAKKTTEELLMNHPMYEFEELVHFYNTSKTCIIDGQERKFIFDYIKEEDKALADYLGIHPALTDKYIPMVKDVKENWDNYLQVINEDKLEQVNDEMERFIVENNLSYDMMDLYRGIIDLSVNRNKIYKYLPIEELNKKDYKKVDYSKMDIPTLRFVRHMTTYLNDVFDKDVPYDDMELVDENLKEMDNVISIKPFIKNKK